MTTTEPNRNDSRHVYGHEAARRAAADTVRTRELVAAVRGAPMPVSGLGSMMVLTLGAWLLIGEFALHLPYTVTGQDTALRDQVFSIAVLLVGVVLRARQGSKPTATVAVLLGLALLACGIWLPHEDGRAMANEIATGVLLVCSALAAGVRPVGDLSAGPGCGSRPLRR